MDFQTCLEVVNKIEAVQRYHLKESALAKQLAELIYNYEIMDLGQLNSLVESLLASGLQRDFSTEIQPGTLLNMEFLMVELSPWAESLRRRIFGSKEAPFRDYDSAVEWIKKFDAESDAVKFSETCYSVKARRNLRYTDKDGEDIIMFARMNSPLERIIFASQRLEKNLEIGLGWDSLVFYVLADTPPFIPPVEISMSGYYVTLPSGRTILNQYAKAKIRPGCDSSFLKWAYEEIRKEMKVAKRKSFSAHHVELFRLVKQKGGAPKGKGVVEFWNSIKDEWNGSERHKGSQYTTWKGVKRGYDLICQKLDAQYQVREVKEDETD